MYTLTLTQISFPSKVGPTNYCQHMGLRHQSGKDTIQRDNATQCNPMYGS